MSASRDAGRPDRQTERLEKRRDERDQRKARRRAAAGSAPSTWLSLRNLTLLALGGGLVGVLILAVLGRPTPALELREPTFRTPTALADGLALGSSSAPVTIDVWSDFQCPGCAAFTQRIEPLLVSDYVEDGRVRLVYHDMAFLGPESVSAAVAARAAARNELFWPFHDYLFANQVPEHNVGNFSQARLEAIAVAVGLDLENFRTAQADPGLRQAVADEQAAAAAAGVASTPTLFIDGQRVEGVPASYPDLAALVDQALAGGG